MHDRDDPLLMWIPNVARQLGIAKGLAYQMARDGRLPSVRLGKRAVRVPWLRLQQWIAEQTREEAARDGDAKAPDHAGRDQDSTLAPKRPGYPPR